MSNFILRVLQGTLIGLGAVLPGISGGVLCVIFGVYTIIMEFLADPFRKLKSHFPRLLPIGIGVIIGFIGVAKLLGFLLEKYENPSVCLFIGLIAGMLPSLYREAGEQGRNKKSYISLVIAMAAVFALLIGLKVLQVEIRSGTDPFAPTPFVRIESGKAAAAGCLTGSQCGFGQILYRSYAGSQAGPS